MAIYSVRCSDWIDLSAGAVDFEYSSAFAAIGTGDSQSHDAVRRHWGAEAADVWRDFVGIMGLCQYVAVVGCWGSVGFTVLHYSLDEHISKPIGDVRADTASGS